MPANAAVVAVHHPIDRPVLEATFYGNTAVERLNLVEASQRGVDGSGHLRQTPIDGSMVAHGRVMYVYFDVAGILRLIP